MELNDKIAARRNELAAEAIATKTIEDDQIAFETYKRLEALGIETGRQDVSSTVDANVRKAMREHAAKLITRPERVGLIIIFLLGILSFLFASWWLGFVFIGLLLWRANALVSSHEKELIANAEEKN